MPACLGLQAPFGPAVCGAGGSPLQEEVIDELLQAREPGVARSKRQRMQLQRQALFFHWNCCQYSRAVLTTIALCRRPAIGLHSSPRDPAASSTHHLTT